VETLFRRLRHGITNLVHWMPVVWNDRDYGYGSLLDMIDLKLRKMADYHEVEGHCVDNTLYARQMRICAQLCRRLSNDDYFFNAIKRYHGYSGESLDHPQNRSKALWRKRSKLISTFADLQKRQDQILLARMFDKHLLNWWD
jgi:hypothetical protein